MLRINVEGLISNSWAPFQDDILVDYRAAVKGRIFLKKKEVINGATINLSKVIGTVHPGYAGEHSLKDIIKMHPRKPELAPSYFRDTGDKPNWSFIEIDDKFYIQDGNFRTAVAKLFFYANSEALDGRNTISGVTVTRYSYDLESEALVKEILDTIKTNRVDYIECKILTGDDPLDGYLEVELRNTSRNINQFKRFHRDDLAVCVRELKRTNFLLRLFSKNDLQKFFKKG